MLNQHYARVKKLGLAIRAEKGDRGWNYLSLHTQDGKQVANTIAYRNESHDDSTEESFETSLPGSYQDIAMKKALRRLFEGAGVEVRAAA